MKAKYVIFQDAEEYNPPVGVVFGQHTQHTDIVHAYSNMVPISAGFCWIETLDEPVYVGCSCRHEKFVCYGESVTLKLAAREVEDADILNKILLS